MAEKIFNWGIIGPGIIADTFASAVTSVADAKIVAAGGRNMAKVNAFADKFDIKNRYNSFLEVVQDSEVDAVYIATPNPFHYENIMMALENGKAVVCEKPLTLTYAEAQRVVAYAKEKGLFLMEAVWTRCLPIYEQVREWINSGAIGDVSIVEANFGFNVPWEEGDRHINPELGGGSLLDVGVYHMAFLRDVIGSFPNKVVSLPVMGETGIDLKAGMVMTYPGGQMSLVSTSVNTDMPQDARIYGSKGMIHLQNYWRADSAALMVTGSEPVVVEKPFGHNGYEYEAIEAMKCIRAGQTESTLIPLDQSLEISKIVNEIRKDWEFAFPGEEA